MPLVYSEWHNFARELVLPVGAHSKVVFRRDIYANSRFFFDDEEEVL